MVMMKKAVLLAIRVYQLTLSPILGGQCRFYPSCSSYTRQAIDKHGVGRGLSLGVRRLLKCHPFHPGGLDNVP
jgi:putative membrane protein insertion efficiency factor